ncbi:hypothetical protein JGY90_10250 [Staphylococcus xylosus]|uniref:hypothetical protein n=1 Tax=Staphylococcus xylosus TaxID=1288 RepID=UPI001CDB6DE3|nr:hypothetical protein [Staphylococcus xylosus]UBV34084.1 hypothetical protein JGY90_10250 [Staphylococcus xylosus]
MKIKTKKQLNLPQLIEWVIENKKFGCTYISNNFNKVYVTDDGIIEFSGLFYGDTFTIITFEEITEDTELEYLYILTDTKDVCRCNNFTINAATKAIGREGFTFFTLVDNDLVKICDKGKLVE